MAAKKGRSTRRSRPSRTRRERAADTPKSNAPRAPHSPDPRPEETPSESPPRSSRLDFFVVGLGASAGGLEALETFLDAVPADNGMAFVVVTHQHPGHVSLLPELLARHTTMRVAAIVDGIAVEPNRVYVSPPGKNVLMQGGTLRLTDLLRDGEPHLPIDTFLRSLASEHEDRAICVVLSGTGTDGTLGLRAVKDQSGLAIVQDEQSARYSGMPGSAAATLLADYVLPPNLMPAQILAYVNGARDADALRNFAEPRSSEAFRKMFGLLRGRTGQDFSGYKVNTVHRRIERRMRVHQIDKPAEYVRLLQTNPHEIDLLFKEMLISVTSFFRDGGAFDALKPELAKLVAAQPEERALRIWVPGCSTGEEAYSIGMLVAEIAGQLKRPVDTQIFATDLDAQAIDYGRAGLYPQGVAADVGRERLARFFSREGAHHRIRKEIREMVVFAVQNAVKDPPFTKLDLISCRNLLIYLNAKLQQRLLPVFHYALKPGGLLLLGGSETIGGFDDFFLPLDRKWKLYERKQTGPDMATIVTLHQTVRPPKMAAPSEARPPSNGSTVSARVEKLLVDRFAPPTVIINDRGDIAYFHGKTGAYLEPSEGEPRTNLFSMAREGLRGELPSVVRTASHENREVVRRGVEVLEKGNRKLVNVIVRKIEDPEPVRGLLRVSFEPVARPAPASTKGRRPRDQKPQSGLERELAQTRDTLQGTIEELQTSNEELKSTNEELQSTNEELQSANEELETSREELQSLNEELQTVNAELQTKMDELSRANDDMQNLLNSTDIATVFLDRDLKIKRFTDQAREVIRLIPGDIGRPVGDLVSHLRYDKLTEDAQRVLDTLIPGEHEVQTTQGEWRLLRMLPYRTSQNVIKGVVITLVDIDRVKRAEGLAAARVFAHTIVETVREPLLVLDSNLLVSTANRSFFRLFKLEGKQVESRSVFEIGGGILGFSRLRELLREIVEKGHAFQDLELVHDFPVIGRRRMLLNARKLEGEAASAGHILLGLDDVTSRPRD